MKVGVFYFSSQLFFAERKVAKPACRQAGNSQPDSRLRPASP